jgi:hypothetical protein
MVARMEAAQRHLYFAKIVTVLRGVVSDPLGT